MYSQNISIFISKCEIFVWNMRLMLNISTLPQNNYLSIFHTYTQIAKFMGPTWGPSGSCRPQMGPCWPHEPWNQGRYITECYDLQCTVYPNKYAHGFCLAVLCCGYTLTDFPISIRLTSLALWQSNDCPSASKATLMNMAKYFMWTIAWPQQSKAQQNSVHISWDIL